MDYKEVHLKLSSVKIDNDNLDYIKATGEICGKLRDDLVKLFSLPNITQQRELLIDFAQSMEADSIHISEIELEKGVDKYLDSINCG